MQKRCGTIELLKLIPTITCYSPSESLSCKLLKKSNQKNLDRIITVMYIYIGLLAGCQISPLLCM